MVSFLRISGNCWCFERGPREGSVYIGVLRLEVLFGADNVIVRVKDISSSFVLCGPDFVWSSPAFVL